MPSPVDVVSLAIVNEVVILFKQVSLAVMEGGQTDHHISTIGMDGTLSNTRHHPHIHTLLLHQTNNLVLWEQRPYCQQPPASLQPNQQQKKAHDSTYPNSTQQQQANLMTCIGLAISFHTLYMQSPYNSWYMDTGSTSHLMSDSGKLPTSFYLIKLIILRFVMDITSLSLVMVTLSLLSLPFPFA